MFSKYDTMKQKIKLYNHLLDIFYIDILIDEA